MLAGRLPLLLQLVLLFTLLLLAAVQHIVHLPLDLVVHAHFSLLPLLLPYA